MSKDVAGNVRAAHFVDDDGQAACATLAWKSGKARAPFVRRFVELRAGDRKCMDCCKMRCASCECGRCARRLDRERLKKARAIAEELARAKTSHSWTDDECGLLARLLLTLGSNSLESA